MILTEKLLLLGDKIPKLHFYFSSHNIVGVFFLHPLQIRMKMSWKEQKLKTLEPPENAATVENISAQIITSIFISELIQVKEITV